jgi:Uncharacterised methyltransferase family (DUF6094)
VRLAAQTKGGYYPAPPEAVAYAASLLCPPEEPFAILDPCCGKGLAIRQLGQAIGCLPEMTWAIELDEGRATDAHTLLTGCHVLAPASFLGTAATQGSFGCIWCNPPFDDEIGGGYRVEGRFLQRATAWLKVHGIMVLVCPERVAERRDIQSYCLQWYEDLACVPFPEDHRPFNEVILIGRKRSKPVDAERLDWDECCRTTVEPGSYPIPVSRGPRRFEKVEFTERELAQALLSSPLRRLLEPPPEPPLAEPPLPLAHGHIALLLASGKLDGIVRPKNEPPHVVRGTARKVEYLSNQSKEEGNDGAVITKTTYSEKIVLTIRAVGADGTIRTFE